MAFLSLMDKATEYRKAEESENQWVMKANELQSLQNELDMTHLKSGMFSIDFE